MLALALLAVLWLIANLLYDVEFQEPGRGRGPITEPGGLPLRKAFESLPGKNVGNSRVRLLDKNTDAWAMRWQLLADAQNRIEISYFILDADIFGISFLGHLLHKARQGVQVRILLDAIGTTLSREIDGNDYLDALAAHPNITIKMYRPYWSRFRDSVLALNPLVFLPSDHDKILITDDRHALTGGRNIAREYLADPLDYVRSFRDTDVLLSTAETNSLLRSYFDAGFRSAHAHPVGRETLNIRNASARLLLAYEAMDAWLRGRRTPRKTAAAIGKADLAWLDDIGKHPRLRGILAQKQAAPLIAEVRLIDSRPRLMRSDDDITQSLILLARAARHDLFIQTPYLILPREALSVFEEAASRGVRVTVLTNSPVSSDNPLSQAFFLEQWPKLLARVPTLRLFVAIDGRNVHGKLAVIDGRLALIGTYNLDPLSMGFDGEVAAAIWSRRFSERLLETPLKLIAGGAPHAAEYRIALDASGKPRRDDRGEVVIAYGPGDHGSADQWKSVRFYRAILGVLEKLPGTSRILWDKQESDEP